MKNKKYTHIICRDRKTNEFTGTIIAISSYAKKPIRGIAKCSPKDNFDVNKGIELAEARCDVKVAEKRFKRAWKKYEEAAEVFAKAKRELERMKNYFIDAQDAYDEAADNLNEIMSKF